MTFNLPPLLIGCATSAVQIEGGDRNNNWYDWAQLPGTIKDGSTPERATDHWNRWREDTELMVSLGLQTYRLGLEWSRIQPRPGEFDTVALDRYRQELGMLVDLGIRPLVTLHHFSHPSWFAGLGGWTSPRAAELWIEYVRTVVVALGDLVSDWVTINEPNVYAMQSYFNGEGPPGNRSWRDTRTVMRHLAVAHQRAYRSIHELQPQAQVGFSHHARVFTPLRTRNVRHQVQARINAKLFQEDVAHAFLGGKFSTFLGGRPAGADRGTFYDFLGLNYYTRDAVSGLTDGTFAGASVNDLGWEIYPAGIVETAAWLHERYPAPIWVTENGTCDNGAPSSAGAELERFRSRFLFDHLGAIARSSLPFARYYHWCFVDNWEWNEGEVARFGIVHLDYDTQVRTVKDSGRFLAQIIAERAVTVGMYEQFVAPQSYPLAQ